MVTTAPRVSPPPTDERPPHPPRPPSGGRCGEGRPNHGVLQVGRAKWRPAHGRWIRASAASARAAAWAVLLEAASMSSPRPAPDSGPNARSRRSSRKAVPFDCAPELSAPTWRAPRRLGQLGLIVGVFQTSDDFTTPQVGSLHSPEAPRCRPASFAATEARVRATRSRWQLDAGGQPCRRPGRDGGCYGRSNRNGAAPTQPDRDATKMINAPGPAPGCGTARGAVPVRERPD